MMVFIWILLLILIFLGLIHRFDPSHGLKLNCIAKAAVMTLAAAAGVLIRCRRLPVPETALLGLLAAYLLTAALTDIQTRTVHDFLHLAAGVPGAVMLIYNNPGWPVILDVLIFLALQMFLFRKMYGTADCLTFCVCAVYLAAGGKGMMIYLLHMGAAFLLLAAIQAIRKNIGRNGNLKKSVALVPYIAMTVWTFL